MDRSAVERIWWLGPAATAGEEDLDGEPDMVEKMPETDMTRALWWRTEPASDERSDQPDAHAWSGRGDEEECKYSGAPNGVDRGQGEDTPEVGSDDGGSGKAAKRLLLGFRFGACLS